MPEPKCWKDLVDPAYRNEVQIANPGTSGTALNTVSTILPLMGEDEGFKFLAAMNKNVNRYTRSGSARILVACVVFRDMTTSTRAGLAALSRIDPSLDEASGTLRAGSFRTIRRVLLPLIRPAVVAALVYCFISAMTSISPVIFLTSPRFDMATVNIVGRAEVGEYGYATAYASVLIVLMILAVVLIRVAVGRRGRSRYDRAGGVSEPARRGPADVPARPG